MPRHGPFDAVLPGRPGHRRRPHPHRGPAPRAVPGAVPPAEAGTSRGSAGPPPLRRAERGPPRGHRVQSMCAVGARVGGEPPLHRGPQPVRAAGRALRARAARRHGRHPRPLRRIPPRLVRPQPRHARPTPKAEPLLPTLRRGRDLSPGPPPPPGGSGPRAGIDLRAHGHRPGARSAPYGARPPSLVHRPHPRAGRARLRLRAGLDRLRLRRAPGRGPRRIRSGRGPP